MTLYTVAFMACLLRCGANLTVTPSNKAVIAGSTAVMNCQTDDHTGKLIWRIFLNNTAGTKTIYTGNKLSNEYHPQFFKIKTTSSGEVSLLIEANGETAQRYICEEQETNQMASAELIVLASNPTCSSIDKPHDVGTAVNPRFLQQRQCSLIFWGNWAPQLEWRQVFEGGRADGEKSAVVTEGVQSGSDTNFIVSTFTIAGNPCRHENTYMGIIRFIRSNKPRHTTAANVPDYFFTWNTTSALYTQTKQSTIALTTNNMSTVIGDGIKSNSAYFAFVSMASFLAIVLMSAVAYITYLHRKLKALRCQSLLGSNLQTEPPIASYSISNAAKAGNRFELIYDEVSALA